MFTLTLDRPKFIRVRAGVTAADIRAEFCCPISDNATEGCIAYLTPAPCKFYVAKPGESYLSIAAKLGEDEQELRRLNGNSPVYPSKKIFIVGKK